MLNPRSTVGVVAALLVLLAGAPARAQEEAAAEPEEQRFRLRVEFKAHFRDSDFVEVRSGFPFPPSFLPPEGAVFLRPPADGSSLEMSTLNLIGEAELSPVVTGRVEVHLLDLYNRNPTSSDDRVQLREAWVRFGEKFGELEALPEKPSAYLLVGKAPRFSRQRLRRLESYGLWGTAVARFEEVGLELGGTIGPHVYWRAAVASGNPLFMRDPNALAGDNGTPERQPNNVHPTFQSGFPILYDAKATDVDVDGEVQAGGGLGLRFVDEDGDGIDVLGWYFRRRLADAVDLPGTTYSGDIQLLEGPFDLTPLPFHGDDKREWGLNVEARAGGFAAFAQYVDQEIAGLPRSGAEVELAWRAETPGLLVGDTPIFRWVQPVVRYSFIDNDFAAPAVYPNPAVDWDWSKYDLGVRVGILPGVDVTAEFSRNDVTTDSAKIHPDELLVTLRAGL